MFLRLLFIIVGFFLVNTLCAQEKKVYVNGSVVLDNQSDYSGVKILFHRVVPNQKDSAFVTDSSGKFGIELDEGIYDISLTKHYYDTVKIKEVNLFADKDIGQIDMHYLGEFLSGEIKGLLKTGTYEVRYSLLVKAGDTLTIEPGTTLKFYEGANFEISGNFYAIGKEDIPIIFTSIEENKYWNGIFIAGEWGKKAEALLDYVIIEKTIGCGLYAGGYKFIDFNHIIFRNNFSKIFLCFLRPPSIIRNSIIINNRNDKNAGAGGLYMNDSEIEIQNCIIANNSVNYDESIPNTWENAGGICISSNMPDRSTFKNCLIYGNKANNAGGIKMGYDTKMINCVIANNIAYRNGSGIYYFGTESAALVNCIISNNKLILNNENEIADYQISIPESEYGGKLDIRNCLIYDKSGMYWNKPNDYFGKFVRTNFNGDSTDAYGNIFLDPMLTDIENNDFTLQHGSPAIDAGFNIDILPLTDFAEHLRLWDGNDDKFAIVDIGAYEYLSPIKLFMHSVSSNDFENGNSGLEITDKDQDGNTFVQTDEESHFGEHCLMLNNSNSTSNDWIISDEINTQTGQKYYLSFWVKYSGEPFTQEIDNLTVNFSSNGDNIINGNDIIFKVDKIEREWQKVLIKLNTDESSNAKFAISANLQSNLKLFIDDIHLETQSLVSVNKSNSNGSDNMVIFPNPASSTINLRYRIETEGIVNIYLTDILGNQTILKSEYMFPCDYGETLNLNAYPQGIYNIVLQNGDRVYRERIMVIK